MFRVAIGSYTLLCTHDGLPDLYAEYGRPAALVVMSAELELAAWDLAGRKLWTTFVEPPWQYTVEDGSIHLDVMGTKSQFDLERGPKL